MRAALTLFLAVVFSLALSACDSRPSSDQIQRQAQETLSLQGNAIVGMPAILNFREKKLYKMILEKRDMELPTITYIQDNVGNLRKLCDSIGYGIPYATQYTNPMRSVSDGHGPVALPQADPNGLFSPANAEGTWILCANPETKQVSPVYVEPRVIVSPFALPGVK